MIIDCPGCHTRFHLKADRHRNGSLKVRCSRCRRVFSASGGRHPEAPAAETLPILPAAPASDAAIRSAAPPRSPGAGAVVIAISNQKGGVAKTSTCLNLGMALAATGKRTLLVDFDIQANLTAALGLRSLTSFYDVVDAGPEALADVIVTTTYDHFYLLPSNAKMALLSRKQTNGQQPMHLLKAFLANVRSDFDFILIDTPPSIEFFTLNALIASDMIIIPSQCESFSVHGVDQIEKAIGFIRKREAIGIDYRILVTMFDGAKTAARVVHRNIRSRYGPKTFDTVIEMDEKLSESQIAGQPVMCYDPTCRAARQYTDLAAEVLTVSGCAAGMADLRQAVGMAAGA